ncbi:MAG: hypothetical protein ACI8P9_004516 [Parasphingorhabdus sp.]|jgi:hypothetical protein
MTPNNKRRSGGPSSFLILISLLFASQVFADPVVELDVLNVANSNGDILVVGGDVIEVGFNVLLDTASSLSKKDNFQLVEFSTGDVLATKSRGAAESGSISLVVPNGMVGQIFVQYSIDGENIVVVTAGNPNEPGSTPIYSIANLTIGELATRVSALESGDIDPTNESQSLSSDGISLTLSNVNGIGGGVVPLPQGPEGPQGIQGPIGSAGSQGPIGATGLDGPQGIQGLVGDTGTQGIQGLTGTTGSQGIQGTQGDSGVVSFAVSNTAGGTNALGSHTSGIRNTALGVNALPANTSGGNNTAIGNDALKLNTTANNHTAFGVKALESNTTGSNNNAFGVTALGQNSSGSQNVAMGYEALAQNTTGSSNTAVGDRSLKGNTTGIWNTALGQRTLTLIGSGSNNIAIGIESGEALVNTNDNIMIGNVGVLGDSGTTRIGNALKQTQTYIAGISNVDLSADVTATQVVINANGQLGIGPGVTGPEGPEGPQGIQGIPGLPGDTGPVGALGLTGATGSTGSQGIQGLQGDAGAQGVQGIPGNDGVMGLQGIPGDSGILSIGTNTSGGAGALASITTGAFNSAFGVDALGLNTDGSANTGIGRYALQSNITGFNNTATGHQALKNSSVGDENTATGISALFSNTTGNANTAIGVYSMYSNTFGQQNTAIGKRSLFNSQGHFNTAVGQEALSAIAGGSNNIGLGHKAGFLVSGSYNIAIGNDGVSGESGVIRIGNITNHGKTFVAGISNVDLSADVTATQVVINANGQLGIGPGVTGPVGPAGPQGTAGINGINGAMGPQGLQGISGADGAMGLQGLPGNDGVAGIQGTQGLPGINGVDGISATSPGNITIVALSGGDYASPADAVADIVSWCGVPSASSPCLIKVAPGVFDNLGLPLIVPFHVHITGSGNGVTVITSSSGSEAIRLSGNNQLRDLSVDVPGSSFVTGISVQGSNVSIQNVELNTPQDNYLRDGILVTATGQVAILNTEVNGFNAAIRSNGGGVSLRGFENTSTNGVLIYSGGQAEVFDSIIRNQLSSSSSASGMGLSVDGVGSSAIVRGSTINTAVSTNSALLRASNSLINGAIQDFSGSTAGTIEILNSQVVGFIGTGSGWGTQTKCVYSSDEALLPLGSNCL